MMFLSKCSVCNSKKLKFLTEQEARGLIDWSKSTNCKGFTYSKYFVLKI